VTLAFGLSLVLEEFLVRRLRALALCVVLCTGVVGCDDGQEPQSPPESEDSVGVADDAEATTSGPDKGSAKSGPEDVARQTADPGVPEMPAEATEDSEVGAEAFAAYYVELINHLGQ
jgi:hypothetical protein